MIATSQMARQAFFSVDLPKDLLQAYSSNLYDMIPYNDETIVEIVCRLS